MTACPHPQQDTDARDHDADQATRQPRLPDGYKKLAPLPAENARQMLAQTATVFSGRLRDVYFSFDDCAGPRTNYVFANATALLGSAVEPEVTLRIMGGPLPGGRWLSVPELPRLALDSDYVVFVRNTDWTYSPVVGAHLLFRKEQMNDREVLVDPHGYGLE